MARLGDSELISWADQAIYTTGRYLTEYQRTRDDAYLDEATTGAQVLNAVVEELRKRKTGH